MTRYRITETRRFGQSVEWLDMLIVAQPENRRGRRDPRIIAAAVVSFWVGVLLATCL